MILGRRVFLVFSIIVSTGFAIPLLQSRQIPAGAGDTLEVYNLAPYDLPEQAQQVSSTLGKSAPAATYPLRAENPLTPYHPVPPKQQDPNTPDNNNDDTHPPASTTTNDDNPSTDNDITTTHDPPIIRPGLLTTCQAEHQFALTFDDGPFEYTSALIDLLIKENVKATFFINGKNYWSGEKINPDLRKAYEHGSEIASHTFTHPKISSLSNDEIKNEMAQNEKAIYGAIQKYPAVMRPPYGDVTDDNVKYLNSLNYTVVTWSIDIKDWDKKPSIDQEMKVVEDALNDSKNHNIILQHDVYKQTATVFAPKVIAFVKSQNLEFVTMSECLQVDAYKPVPISE